MTLPFNNNNKQKKYQCFVCGMQFNDDDNDGFQNYQKHIKETHEEGREFVKCPIEYCSSPVRCLRTHFKAKHPGVAIPKNQQMKALIWYDHSNKKRKRTKKPAFKEGYFVSEKNNFESLHYRSGLELQMYELLEQDNRVYKYEIEPKDCEVKYFFQGKMHTYHPDIKVIYKDGSINVVEVKPSEQTDAPINEAKWSEAAKVFGQRDWPFSVKTQMGIDRLRREIAEQKKSN